MKTSKSLLALCLFLAFTACTAAPAVPPISPIPPTGTATEPPAASATPEPTGTPLPASTPTKLPTPTAEFPTLTPLVTAPFMFMAGWSPDSLMLAYWTFTEEEMLDMPVEGAAGYPSGTLHFLDVTNNTTCDYPFAAHYSFIQPTFKWLEDGRALIRGDDGAIRAGVPCGAEFETLTGVEAEVLLGHPEFSPDGKYRAQAEIEYDPEAGLVFIELTITELASGAIASTVAWQEDLGIGVYSSPGGQWVGNELFIVATSLDQGPLLVRPGEPPIQAAPELFGVEGVCAGGGFCGVTVYLTAAPGPEPGNFHAMLWHGGDPSQYPNLMLYHSESGEVEELAFHDIRWPGFSPNGLLLLLHSPVDDYNLWVRPVEEVGGRAIPLISATLGGWAYALNDEYLAFGDEATQDIYVAALADGLILNTWDIGKYQPWQLLWAPNSARLAVVGAWYDQTGEEEYALFLAGPVTPPP